MTRLSVCGPALLLLAAGAAPALAQAGRPPVPIRQIAAAQISSSQLAAVGQGDLHGTVLDDRGQPLQGAVVSAVGATSAFAVSDRAGAFAFRNLPVGPYLLRAHLQGYVPTRGRIIQVNGASRAGSTISLTRKTPTPASEEPQVLEAGVGATATSGEPAAPEGEEHDHGEVAWRLRHLKRSVLKDTEFDLFGDDSDNLFDRPAMQSAGFSRAADGAGWLAALALNGQINLLTRTSLDRPQDLFSLDLETPRGITYIALSAPTVGGDWSMRGAMTQGDLSSWILSGAYVRRAPAAHRYEAGLTYGTQTYRGGNAAALAAVADGTRNVGAVYAYDNWAVSERVDVSYGAKYARYDYLADRALFSPRASVSIAPIDGSSLLIQASAARREVAPGAGEFMPPSTGLWLPPERTFSPVNPRGRLNSERIDHFEVSVERQYAGDFMIGVRAFRENVDDQIVTLFGIAPANVGHYFVASGGDFDATGWGLSIHRNLTDRMRASFDYTSANADWRRASPDQARLLRTAASTVRTDNERVHDLTASVESELPSTATRLVLVYKVNSAFAAGDGSGERGPSARYQVQVNQALPFLNFSSAEWEMLVAVRNLFSEDFRDASVYDELLVVRPPTRIVGGLTVRF